MQKIFTRKRILQILGGLGFWILGVTFEDSVKKWTKQIFDINIVKMNINPYMLTITILFILFVVGLILYWKWIDLKKRRNEAEAKYLFEQQKREEFLLSEVRKAQTAALYSYQFASHIKREIEIKEQKSMNPMSNYVFLNNGDLQQALQNFDMKSMELIQETYFINIINEFRKSYPH